ncbi:helicase RepA family protein [Pseudomonas sp. MAP12]|uniref:Helicase RepA family protein n=1 Tax=Geopseudomonas aromaticivorans TaxID=2849492 RepID=A0ABS6MZ44_9GAMM|nr:helicase RepA family protein [Pseudomonas aromaticivorans]MBV2134068.1 helicase RepA family protein [Pseudomonas aromaticivorans]
MTVQQKDPFKDQWTEIDQRLASTPPFRFIAACEMPVNPIAWLIESYIEADALAVLYGPPGKGKSFLALDMSCCIATGQPFHGHDVKPGAVFYIAGEGHNGLARRLRAWAQHNDTEMPVLLFMSEAPTDLASASNAAKVAEAVQQLADRTGETPALIVIDTMARNFGGDENSATDVGQFIRNADALRRHWKATVLIVHHSGKNGERGARGSSALKGAADAEYEVSRSEDDQLIRLTPRKMKDAEEPPPLAFELIGVPVRDDAGSLVGGAALKLAQHSEPDPVTKQLGKHQKAALDVLQQMHTEIADRLARQGREGHPVLILVDDWRAKCEANDMPRNRFHDAKSSLADRQQIRLDGPHVLLVRPVLPHIGRTDRTDSSKDVNTGQIGREPDANRTDTGQPTEAPDYEDI